MRITVTGATGLIGTKLVTALMERGDEVAVLSRNPDKAAESLPDGVEAVAWDPQHSPAPTVVLDGRDAVVHLAGEPVAQRWNDKSKHAIRESRDIGTKHLVAGIEAADPRPRALIASSAVGYYGKHGEEELTEDTPPGDDFLADVSVVWEERANAASALGLRVVNVRTGVVLDPAGGALAKMLLPFKLGVGGPVAGGDQYLPWIHVDDLVRLYLAAIDGEEWSGPVNATAPGPVTNAVFSKALGRALHRPAVLPIPGFALQVLYGDMAEMVTEGQRAVPARATELGFTWEYADLDAALGDSVH